MEEVNRKKTKTHTQKLKQIIQRFQTGQIEGQLFLYFSRNWEREGEMKIHVFSYS